jgi:glutamate-1-semialdehyde 2,1-aminomutase
VISYAGVDQVRFVSSGTEAVMSAVRLARGATGRDLVVKFSGCYHGHVDYLLVAAGSGLVTFGQPSSQGVPRDLTALTRVLPLDDPAAAEQLFAAEGDRIAAVIIEPVPANNGLLLQRAEFLKTLRTLCTKHGALLIFDEVITGFRLGAGGAAAYYGIKPDLVTFGKVIGGGMPVGAFAGPRKLMQYLSPEGGVYQAGTLSGNPVAMTAGLATLRVLHKEDGWKRLETLGTHLEQTLVGVLAEAPLKARLCRLGSLFWIAWHTDEQPRAAEALDPKAATVYASVFHSLLDQGIALAPSAFEIAFLSLAHTRRDIDRLAEGLRAALAALPSD